MIGLAEVRRDLWAILDQAPAESPALRAALVAGEVDGRVYTGHCACLVGTLAKARGCDPEEVVELQDPLRPAEDWFWPIHPGDVPGENGEGPCRAAMAVRWVDEWRDETALRFVRLGEEAGGQLILSHPASRAMRQAFLDAQVKGWLDGEGYVTQAGRLQLEETT